MVSTVMQMNGSCYGNIDLNEQSPEIHDLLHENRVDENEEEIHSKELFEMIKKQEIDYGVTEDTELINSPEFLDLNPIPSGDSSPASRSGHSSSPLIISTPNTPGNNYSCCDSASSTNSRFVYPCGATTPEGNNGGLSPRPFHGKQSTTITPPGHVYGRAESHTPFATPSSPCPEYKSRPSTTSLPSLPLTAPYYTTPRCSSIITVHLPYGMHTKVKRNKLKDTILKSLNLRNIQVRDCNIYQMVRVPSYRTQRMELDLDSLDKMYITNELFVEHKKEKLTSNSPHKFTKKKLHLEHCSVCKKYLFKDDFFTCEKCKAGFHGKCLQMDLVCTAGPFKPYPAENVIRNGNTAERKTCSALGFRSRSNSEPKDPLDASSPPPITSNKKTEEERRVMTKYLVPLGEKINQAQKYPHKAVSNASSFPTNPVSNELKRRISDTNYLHKSPRRQHKISLPHPLRECERKTHAGYLNKKRSLGVLADHDNQRSKSISNLDIVTSGNSPDPVLTEMRIGSAPTSPKSNTPTPTSPPLSSTPYGRREPIYSACEPTMLRNTNKASNCTRFSTWELPSEMIKKEELIGQGSYGTVYKGEYHGTVAIKMLTCNDPSVEQLEAFKIEIEMLRQTRHDNILLFMGYITQPLSIVTSWCDGNTLYYHIHVSEEELPQEKLNLIVLQTAQGMSYLHTSRKIIHRDLKSQNIFLLSDYTVKIGDFGLATMKSRWAGSKQYIAPQGSVLWMAPEVMRAGTKDHEDPYSFYSDVYSFGIVLYELITGELPFKDQHIDFLLFQIGLGFLKPEITFVHKSTPQFQIELCNRCIEFNKEDRPLFSDFTEQLETEMCSDESDSDNDIFLSRKINRRVSETNLSELLPSWPIILDHGLGREIQTLPYNAQN